MLIIINIHDIELIYGILTLTKSLLIIIIIYQVLHHKLKLTALNLLLKTTPFLIRTVLKMKDIVN